MQQLFDQIGKNIYVSNNHYGYLINYTLIAPLCKTWSGNRIPDSIRIEEMYEYYTNNGYIPKILHLAEICNDGLVCYDGNHRRKKLFLKKSFQFNCQLYIYKKILIII